MAQMVSQHEKDIKDLKKTTNKYVGVDPNVVPIANILEAIETFRKDCKNTDLVAELDPWLNSLVDAVVAAEGSLSSVVALEEENYADAWSSFAEASKAFQTWNTYKSADDILQNMYVAVNLKNYHIIFLA